MEPDDDIDFDSDGSLSVVDIADLLAKGHLKNRGPTEATAEVQEVRLVNGRLVSVAPPPEKIPCEGVTVMGKRTLKRDGHVMLEPVSIDAGRLDDLSKRQDRLAGKVQEVLTHTVGRVSALEGRPTPFWHLGKIQKSCLLLFAMWMVFFFGLMGLSVLGHLLKAYLK